jgi:glycosyltransferase involved in cell wall biosynthesis
MRFFSVSPISFENWDYRNPDDPGIGGSETAVVQTAWRLARRGHEVTVYAPIREDTKPEWRGTTWKSLEDPAFYEPGIWLVSRSPQTLDYFATRHEKQKILLWAQDADYPDLTDERWNKLDYFVALCPTHFRISQQRWPKWKDKIVQTYNGIRVDLIDAVELERIERDPKKIVFASSPDRGLLEALKIFRRIREYVSGAQLVAAYGLDNINKIVNDPSASPYWKMVRDELVREMDQPGVMWAGRLGQPDLMRLKLSCGMSIHPTMFTETGGISFLEEMACGAIPIITPVWAAGDYCNYGVWLYGNPQDPITQARFAGETWRLMANPSLQAGIRKEMMPWARATFDWEGVIDKLEIWANSEILKV